MAAAVAAPTRIRAGDSVSFVATGFAATHAISLVVTGPDQSFILHDAAVTDGSGNFTWTNEIDITALGNAAWSINDGTSTVSGVIQVTT